MLSFTVKNRRVTLGSPLLVLLVVWIFSLAYYYQLRDVSFEAQLLPMTLLIGLLLAGLCIIRENVVVEKVQESIGQGKKEKQGAEEEVLPSKKVLLFILGTAIAIWFFVNTVAVVAIIPCTAILLYITGIRKIKTLLLVPIVLSGFIYIFFEKWLSVSLPNMFF